MRMYILLVVAALLQVSLLPYVRVGGAVLNMVLVLVTVSGFANARYRDLVLPTMLAGIVLESVSHAPFGIILSALALSVIALDGLAWVVPHHTMAYLPLFVVGGTLCFEIVTHVVMKLVSGEGMLSSIGVLSAVAYNIVGAFAVLPLRRWITL